MTTLQHSAQCREIQPALEQGTDTAGCHADCPVGGIARHTEGPWALAHNPAGVQSESLEITTDGNGRFRPAVLYIGNVPLRFRPRRSGSHKGETMEYGEFTAKNVADARLIAAAPELLAACRLMAAALMGFTAGELHSRAGEVHGPTFDEAQEAIWSAIRKATEAETA